MLKPLSILSSAPAEAVAIAAAQVYLCVMPVLMVVVALVVVVRPGFRRGVWTELRASDAAWIAPAVLAALGLHAGYVVAPFWFGTSQAMWSFWMMAPWAAVVVCVSAMDGGLRSGLTMRGGWGPGRIAAGWALVMGYVGPPAVVLVFAS